MKPTSKPTVAIIYGFAEGRYHGRGLRTALQEAGFTPVENARKADIIIAHSAGCYLVPADHQARVVLHIGYTYWPGKRLLRSLRENLAYDYRHNSRLTWLKRCIINDFYMLQIVQTIRMYRGWHDPGLFLESSNPGKHIFVRNRYDTYCEPAQLLARAENTSSFISLPGAHNHIWDHPDLYVDLLQSVRVGNFNSGGRDRS